jgi:hypothetical protein
MFDYGGLFLQNITILSVETKRIDNDFAHVQGMADTYA